MSLLVELWIDRDVDTLREAVDEYIRDGLDSNSEGAANNGKELYFELFGEDWKE